MSFSLVQSSSLCHPLVSPHRSPVISPHRSPVCGGIKLGWAWPRIALRCSSFSLSGSYLNVADNKNETYNDLLQTNSEGTPMVGLDSMLKANGTLELFCKAYFMFHKMDENRPESLFEHLPVLSFTESFIYQLDCLNEKILYLQTSGVSVSERGCKEGHQRLIAKLIDAFKSNPFRPLLDLLEFHGLLTKRIKEEFKRGEEYWALERKLCCAVINKEEICIEDVMRAAHIKSFDFRILNLLLYQLRGEKVNDLHMEFLPVGEFLGEVSDDLFDYEVNVLENSFNVLRMFVHIYGASRAPTMLEKYIIDAELKYGSLLKTLDPQLATNYHNRFKEDTKKTRREEVTKEGGRISGHVLGTWSMPNVIEDEELYRTNFLNSRRTEVSGLRSLD